MFSAIADLTRYLDMPSKGITLSITGATTSGDTISEADGQKYLRDAEAKIARVFGDVPWTYARIATAYTADAVSVVVDKIDTDDWTSTGQIYFNGINVSYTGRTTTGFSGLSSDYTIPAAPVGTFIIDGVNCQGLTGFDIMKNYESELYYRLDLICKEAAYNIWVTRFPADAMPKVIDTWKMDVDKAIAQKSSGNAWLHL